MELRVGHFQTKTVKTKKLVIVFEQYKKFSTLENSFQIMTLPNLKLMNHAYLLIIDLDW